MESQQQEDPLNPLKLEAESFIPFLQDDLVEMCLDEGILIGEDAKDFRELAAFLSASANFSSHRGLDAFARQYAHFNPDSEMRLSPLGEEERAHSREAVVQAFRDLAENANYRPLRRSELEAAFEARSLINLRTAVDLDEFAQIECYVRGARVDRRKVRDWLYRRKEVPMAVWRRVLLLMQFKPDEELTKVQLKRRRKANLSYQPGKIYVYLFKEVPKNDIEILFPNVRVSMNLKDMIMIGVPAVVAAFGTFTRIGFQVTLIVGLIVFALFGKKIFGVDEKLAEDMMRVATAVLAILVACTGFCFKQWTTIKNKRIGFLKEVSEHLFFRNIAMNKAVFSRIIEDGDNEDTKEALLVFYHMLIRPEERFTRETLDERIQEWMKERHDTVIDFDIDDPIDTLKKIRGRTNAGEEKALIIEDEDGTLHLPTLDEAKEIMDYHWDNAFQYSKR